MAAINPFPCANMDCTKASRSSCSKCKLVSAWKYCEKRCQVAHWPTHKRICKSPLMSDTWQPCWETEDRRSEMARTVHHNPFGQGIYPWGNVPAVDVLNLAQNEGNGHCSDIALLFAASGDLRNVVKTISELSEPFTRRIEATLNDREFYIVARNAILLLFSLTALEAPSIPANGLTHAEALIHLWYSASLPSEIRLQLVSRVKPLFTDVCEQISAKGEEEIVEKTWNFSNRRSMRLVLKKEDWFRLEALCDVPPDLTQQKARHATPSARVAKQRFRKDGLLLPFGHHRVGFDCPNPTFFLPPYVWPMDDKADPLDGWPIREVARVQTMAKEDLYGKLYIYLRKVFQKFLDRLARTEVSNITDAGYLGTRETLRLLSPLLQPPHENPHATMISSYLNAIMEMVNQGDTSDQTPNVDLLMQFLPDIDLFSFLRPDSAQALKFWDARTVVLDRDKFFNRYMRAFRFNQISADLQVAMKDVNTVVEAWPTKPILEPGQKGSQEEFDILLGSNYTCVERFVEWRRTR
ncbi:hypothetical protein BJY00DRAFT_321672 [Aspergillus carlsbadensis]|nr:hypothetical protein BJY00DRAFT_321672 [Aspergillus carlsbadensis]